MKTLHKYIYLLSAALLVSALALMPAFFVSAQSDPGGPPSGDGVDPIYVAGNPSCTTIGFGFGFKVDGSPNGTFTFTNPPGVLTGGAPPDPSNSVTISGSDGNFFDWAATLGIDAVIVKGGPNADAFVYINEDTGDTELHAPINPSNGSVFGVSHIEFCYDYEVTVTKTANPTFTRTFQWNIDKSVTPEEWDLFTGDRGRSEYVVELTKTGFTDSNWAVNGTIIIQNNTPSAATITGVSDSISGFGAVAPNCGVAFPYGLAAGGTLNCSYSTALPDGTSRTNTATVTTSGPVGGGTATADIIFGSPTTVVNDSVTVTDTNAAFGGPKTADASTTWKYTRTFTCDDDEGKHDNTAAITETGQSDQASVTVNCYELEVDKDAKTSFKRTYDWTIDKSADKEELTLSTGQTILVNYSVVVNATFTDSNWAVSGGITVHNPAPMAATINSVSDVVSGVGAAVVDCGVTFPYSLAAGGTLECTYSVDLPNTDARTNTATATLQNYDYDESGASKPSGTTGFSKTINFNFDAVEMIEVDECIDVTDTLGGDLGTVCYDDLPKTFTYSYTVGPYEVCGDYTVENTASFIAKDTGATGSDSWSIPVDVPCLGGCTLTQGYWKTHSKYGPAPYDDTWALLGEDTPFYLSGKTYYEVLWTNPQGGNAYYILAHQFIAAKLNLLNGASSTPAVDAALAAAETFFATYEPTDQLSKAQRKEILGYAFTLDQYNNGFLGPGHCSDNDVKRASLLLYFDQFIVLPIVKR